MPTGSQRKQEKIVTTILENTARQKLRACWADDIEPGKGTAYETSGLA